MKNKIILAAKSVGCSEIGIVRARKFFELTNILERRGRVSFVEPDYEKRINPFLIMGDVKSIIVCLFSYYNGQRGKISSYAHGKDYHPVIKEKLEKICDVLNEQGAKTLTLVDNSPLVERYLAYLCGLGFFGKNTMLINERLGSEFFIGCILTDFELDEDRPLDNDMCIGCNRCIEACPGGALQEGFLFDENKCVSFLTQKKGELTQEEKEIIKKSGYIWGCDKCTEVCPYNKNLPITGISEFKNELITDLEISEEMSNKEFKKMYGDRAFSWRGKSILLRNQKIISE